MKIFLVDFLSDSILYNALHTLENVEVYLENTDGGKAYKSVGDKMPDYVVVNIMYKPTHGLETAKVIKNRKKTQNIPIVFIADTQNHFTETKNIGETMTLNEVLIKFKNITDK